jgi:shikimate 5-dehydrogenase
MQQLKPAEQPTFYFIGVTTGQSSIMRVFPEWARELGLTDAVIQGIDIDIHADPAVYREVVRFIRDDALSLGALVTTHKIDLYQACRDMFDHLDPYAVAFGELSAISKKEGRLEGYAKDPISSGLALDAFVPAGWWRDHDGQALLLGAGGSAIAIGAYLMRQDWGDNRPSGIVVANRSQPRLDEIRRIFDTLDTGVPVSYHLTPNAADNDVLLAGLNPYSLVVNATGLGKDRPGSPLTDACLFPQNGLVWELNYRGDLRFMHQALAQREARSLLVEDGWKYFIHGWTQVIAEVFHVAIPPEAFAACETIANRMR